MRPKGRNADPWEGYELMDWDSQPGERGRRPAGPRAPSGRRGQASPPRPRRRPPRPRPQQPERRRPRRRMGKTARRLLMLLTLACMAGATAFLCVFLLFKVRNIEITGDLVYEQAAILEVCGYQQGDNLALLTTGPQERALEEQLPYIEDAQVLRHFPSTLEIHIIGAKEAACVASGSQWFSVSTTGKVLAECDGPQDGVMQVTGLVLTDPVPGERLQAQDESYQAAFEEIVETLAGLSAYSQFTALDLTDLYNITLEYQGRVLFQLGSTVELAYKVEYGYGLVSSTDPVQIAQDKSGTLDLTMAPEAKKAYFAETVPGASPAPEPGEEASSSSPEGSGGDEGASSQEPGEESSSSQPVDRGEGIPDTPFTG